MSRIHAYQNISFSSIFCLAIFLYIVCQPVSRTFGGEPYDILMEADENVKVLLSSGYSEDGRAAELSRKMREILDEE